MRGYRLLCTGDIHVGRRPSRVGAWVDGQRCSCAAMFGRIVDLAIEQRVDVVLLSGDLVDQCNKYYEAYGAIERGLRRLAEADIDAVAVTGNHDFDVLPRLADDLASPRFHLLGRGGRWQCITLLNQRPRPLRVVGWSFPSERVVDGPMSGCVPAAIEGWSVADNALTLGLLHGDLEQADSVYAPLALRDLQAAPLAMWLLGHVHRPKWIEPQVGRAGVLYPGSPQAMDPGEPGPHGPWLIELDAAGQVVAARQVPLSVVRYDQLDVDVTGINSGEAFDTLLSREVRQHLQQHCQEAGPLELCCLRVRVVGTTALHRQLRQRCATACEDLELTVGRCRARLDTITLETRPPVDLPQLARGGGGVVGDLARLLLSLRGETPSQDEPAMEALLRDSAEAVEEVCASRAFQPLPADTHPVPGASVVREALLRQGMQLLDELLGQKRSEEGMSADEAGGAPIGDAPAAAEGRAELLAEALAS